MVQSIEREAFQKLLVVLPSRKGKTVVICSKCGKRLQEYESKVNGLNEWAFKEDEGDGIPTSYHRDSRGCCLP